MYFNAGRCAAAPGTCVHCRLNCSTRHPLFVSYSPLLPPLETHLVSYFLDVHAIHALEELKHQLQV